MMIVQLGKHNIIFTDSFCTVLKGFMASHTHKSEAGGILLGQVVERSIYVLQLSFPNLFDKVNRHEFIRDKNAAQIIIDFSFYNSVNKTIYLGEWHTHPEDNPSPSPQDHKMIASQFLNNQINEDFLLLLIIGYKKAYIRLITGKAILQTSISLNELFNE
jgi:integrative and conjugative element protein (TIGR02256 family)